MEFCINRKCGRTFFYQTVSDVSGHCTICAGCGCLETPYWRSSKFIYRLPFVGWALVLVIPLRWQRFMILQVPWGCLWIAYGIGQALRILRVGQNRLGQEIGLIRGITR